MGEEWFRVVRQAGRHLAVLGLSRRHVDRVLATGLAGEPLVTPAPHLYDDGAVARLLLRRELDDREVREACPQGLLVARRAAVTIEQLADGWGIAGVMTIWIEARVRRRGFVPLVATVGGFVTRGAEIVGATTVDGAEPTRPWSSLTLRAPTGVWSDRFRDARSATGTGRPWSLVGFDTCGMGG